MPFRTASHTTYPRAFFFLDWVLRTSPWRITCWFPDQSTALLLWKNMHQLGREPCLDTLGLAECLSLPIGVKVARTSLVRRSRNRRIVDNSAEPSKRRSSLQFWLSTAVARRRRRRGLGRTRRPFCVLDVGSMTLGSRPWRLRVGQQTSLLELLEARTSGQETLFSRGGMTCRNGPGDAIMSQMTGRPAAGPAAVLVPVGCAHHEGQFELCAAVTTSREPHGDGGDAVML